MPELINTVIYIIQQLLFKMDIIQQIKAQIFQQLDFLFLCIIAVLNDLKLLLTAPAAVLPTAESAVNSPAYISASFP